MDRVVAELGGRVAIAARRRILVAERAVNRALNIRSRAPRGFFDAYPRFFESSVIGATANRLNERHRAQIEANRALIDGKSVLDIASHDGRWSFAALNAGAKRVLGIEVREHLIESANINLRACGVAEDRFAFICGDVCDKLDEIGPGSIDTVLCFGFFYHTLNHLHVLSKIAQLKPRHLILDTRIDLRPVDAIFLRMETTEEDGNVAVSHGSQGAVGFPTLGALNLMLAHFGWTGRYYDWRRAGIRDWDDLQDYQEGSRVTLTVDCDG